MKLYERVTQTHMGARTATYTLGEIARLRYLTDTALDELAELYIGQRWLDSNGNWWERVA